MRILAKNSPGANLVEKCVFDDRLTSTQLLRSTRKFYVIRPNALQIIR